MTPGGFASRLYSKRRRDYFIGLSYYLQRYKIYIFPSIKTKSKSDSCMLRAGCGLALRRNATSSKANYCSSIKLRWRQTFRGLRIRRLSLSSENDNGIKQRADSSNTATAAPQIPVAMILSVSTVAKSIPQTNMIIFGVIFFGGRGWL